MAFPHPSWRPWSLELDVNAVDRSFCGLLNTITASNFNRIADQFCALSVRLERVADQSTIQHCATMLMRRCVKDPPRSELLAKLVQRAADEAEGESLQWRSVDAYYLEDPARSLPTAVRVVLVQALLGALQDRHEHDACTLSHFAGHLVLLGVLACEDIEDVVTSLFEETAKNSDFHCAALIRLLRLIVTSPEASHIIDSLGLVALIEDILQEDSISMKIRYTMMNFLDQCIYPRPKDVFGSDIRRSEAYGFHLEEIEDHHVVEPTSSPTPLPEDLDKPSLELLLRCSKCVHQILATRSLPQAESSYLALSPTLRRVVLKILISSVMESGDECDANLAVSFLTLPAVKRALFPVEHLSSAFEPEVVKLEDTVLDVPNAYRIMATMLAAVDLPPHIVEDVASRIVVRENSARDRLLDELQSLKDVGGDFAQLTEMVDPGTDEELEGFASSEYEAYAY